jgi:hypothetical protein
LATVLDKALRRQIAVDGVDYTLALDPEGMRLTRKGGRRPEVALRWRDLVSGDAAMVVALNASLSARPAATGPEGEAPVPSREDTPGRAKRAGPRHR